MLVKASVKAGALVAYCVFSAAVAAIATSLGVVTRDTQDWCCAWTPSATLSHRLGLNAGRIAPRCGWVSMW